jgi:hypothetical protein
MWTYVGQGRTRSAAWVIALAGVLVGCGSQPPRVSCDGRLQPINKPAKPANASENRTSAETAPGDKL